MAQRWLVGVGVGVGVPAVCMGEVVGVGVQEEEEEEKEVLRSRLLMCSLTDLGCLGEGAPLGRRSSAGVPCDCSTWQGRAVKTSLRPPAGDWPWGWALGTKGWTPDIFTTLRTGPLSALKAGTLLGRSGGLPGGPPTPLLLPPPGCTSRLLDDCSCESLLQFWLPSLRSLKTVWASEAALRGCLSGRMTAAEEERL